MRRGIKVLWAVVAILIMNGCVGTPDSEGWRYGQKNEFLNILENDKYMSICNQQTLYSQVKESRNSRLMTKMLVAYAKNLANGCIDLAAFKVTQREKKARKVESHYETYLQKVDKNSISMQVKAGQTIENILKPYIPKNEQFSKLISGYHLLSKEHNVTQSQLNKVRINIERVKLMNDNLGNDYALVNIPEFVVRIKKGNKTDLKFAVIVGKTRLQTPIFAAPLLYVTINPQWSVPDSIARNEIIPKLLRNPNYLTRKRMVMRSDYNLKSKKLTPSSVNLKAYVGGKGPVPFKFIEIPSKRNGLGRVKFIFPNRHSVYMHDTQSKGLFKRKVRTYSHGCVRLEKPNKLLKYVTTNYTTQSNEKVHQWYDSLKTHHLKINKHVMVHTAYLTAYVAEDGKLLFFNDIYGYDKSQKLNFN